MKHTPHIPLPPQYELQARAAATACLEPISHGVRKGLDAAKGPTDAGTIDSLEYKQSHQMIVNLCMNFTVEMLKTHAMLAALKQQIEQPVAEAKGKVTLYKPDGTVIQ